MAVHGSLLTMPLADLLVWIMTSARAGLISIMRDGNEWELEVSGKTVTGYAGPELRDNLGHIVVTSGMLTEEDLRTAYQFWRQNGGTLQRALLERGLLTRHQLEECLKELATESIYDLFIDLPGDFVFTEQGSDALGLTIEDRSEHLAMDLNVNHLLMEGARRQDEWLHIRERFPHDDIVVRVVYDHVPPFEELGVRERRILASLSAGQSISDICLELRAPIPSVLRIIAAFEKERAVEVVDDTPRSAGAEESERVRQLRVQAQVLLDDRQFEEGVALLEAAVRLRPTDEDVRVDLRDAKADQVRELYRELPPVCVPRIVANDERLRALRLRPDERFLLERLTAQMDVGSLVMMSAMSERETLKTLKRFLHSGIVALDF